MKKYFILLTALTISASLFAQESEVEVEYKSSTSVSPSATAGSIKSKRGEEVLPQAGDVALGISATPFLNYVGRIFTGGNTAPTFAYPNHPNTFPFGAVSPGNAIWYKRMIDANTAHRARIQFDFGNFSRRYSVEQSTLNYDPNNITYVEDKQVNRVANVLIALGLEKRRGSTRLQGVYGAEGMIGFFNTITKNEFANAINLNFNAPASAIPGAYPAIGGNPYSGSARIIENDPGKLFFVGARAFAGVEYFFLPKVSIGSEFGYTLGFTRSGLSSTTYEVWDAGSNSVREFTVEGRNGNVEGIGIGLDNLNINLNLLLYF